MSDDQDDFKLLPPKPARKSAPPVENNVATVQKRLFDAGENDLRGQQWLFEDVAVLGEKSDV